MRPRNHKLLVFANIYSVVYNWKARVVLQTGLLVWRHLRPAVFDLEEPALVVPGASGVPGKQEVFREGWHVRGQQVYGFQPEIYFPHLNIRK
jgi:hypothetical protein